MNTVLIDPKNPTVAIIGTYTDPVFGSYAGDAGLIRNVHLASQCEGRPCVIHSPTDHHMRKWDLHWRDDRGIFERICLHGIGHPDPDQFEFWKSVGRSYEAIHGCDSCCVS